MFFLVTIICFFDALLLLGLAIHDEYDGAHAHPNPLAPTVVKRMIVRRRMK